MEGSWEVVIRMAAILPVHAALTAVTLMLAVGMAIVWACEAVARRARSARDEEEGQAAAGEAPGEG